MSRPQRPVPPPLEGNDRLITAVITAGFLLALIVLLVVRHSLPTSDRWWIWVPAFGTVLGVFGLLYVPYLKRSRERAAEGRRLEREAAGYHSATDISAGKADSAGMPVTAPDGTATAGTATDSTVTDSTVTDSTVTDSTGAPPR